MNLSVISQFSSQKHTAVASKRNKNEKVFTSILKLFLHLVFIFDAQIISLSKLLRFGEQFFPAAEADTAMTVSRLQWGLRINLMCKNIFSDKYMDPNPDNTAVSTQDF